MLVDASSCIIVNEFMRISRPLPIGGQVGETSHHIGLPIDSLDSARLRSDIEKQKRKVRVLSFPGLETKKSNI